MQKEEYLIRNACYSVTKYYLCKQNNKRSLLGRKQRSQVVRSFLNRYQFCYISKVTSLFSDRYIFIIILKCKSMVFVIRKYGSCFCYAIVCITNNKVCVFRFLYLPLQLKRKLQRHNGRTPHCL